MRGARCAVTTERRTARRAASAAGVVALAVLASNPARSQTCTFNANPPGSVNFGSINPALATPATFSARLDFNCLLGAIALVSVSGQNDSGPAAHRLKHATQVPARYIPYAVSTVVVPGVRITITGQIASADYQNAYAGSYTDTLTVLLLP